MTVLGPKFMNLDRDWRALARTRNGRLVLAALGAGGSAGLALLLQRSKAHSQGKPGRTSSLKAGGTKKDKKRKNTAAASVNKLLSFLLPLVGRRIIVLFALAVLRTAISNRLARVQGYMFRAAFLKRVPLFMRDFLENVVLCVVAAGVETTSKRFTDRIAVKWRQILTSQIHRKYFDNMTYYKLSYVDGRISTPEHRLCEDIPRFCDGLADLLREWINSAVDAAVFAYLLRSYSNSHKYTLGIMGYVLGAGIMTTVFAPNFGRLFSKQQENEGEYRNLQQRLTNNAESIAFYGGIRREGSLIKARFRQLVKHQVHLLHTQWRFSMWQDFHTKYLAATVAVVIIIGPFFTGHLRPDDSMRGRASMLSNMRYHTSVIIALFSSLGTLASSSRKLMKLGAYADRITGLQDVTRHVCEGKLASKLPQAGGSVQASDDEIAFEKALVVTPSGATLVQDLSLRVPAGTNLLVTGPNGSGKSSLFRVLGGLWPLTGGTVRKPGGAEGGLAHDIFYVPQRPYVTIGTLQDQLIYPSHAQEGGDVIPEAELRDLLAQVDLEYLADSPGGLGASLDWGAQLSLGEQQRLGFGRLLYHRPKFAILDECTSGVTVDMEERFCNMVKAMGCTCVTISHRPALVAFHDIVLALDGEGGWSLHKGARPSSRSSSDDNSFEALSAGEETPEQQAAQGTKARTEDAAACLTGMRAMISQQGQAASARADDSLVIAEGPSSSASEMPAFQAPSKQLQPSKMGTWNRWKMVLHELLGQGRGTRQLAGIMVVVIMRTALQDRIAALNGRSVQHVLRQDRSAFVRLIAQSAFQSLLSAMLAPSLRFVTDGLALSWRRRLTSVAHRMYLKGNTFYSVSQLAGMQDVDQRLTRDIERLCDDLSSLIPSLVKPLVDLAWFSVALGRLTGKRGMGVLYLYAILGFGVLHAVTPNFGALLQKEYGLEGAFRSVHTRLRTHAESIAFFGGGTREGTTIAGYFDRLLAHRRSVIDIRWAYSMADDFFTRQLPHNVTWALTLLYALDSKGEFSDTAVQGELVSNMRYLASVVTQCFTAFGELLALHKRFVELSGGINRVSEMLEVMHKSERAFDAPALTQGQQAAQDSITFEEVDACTPTGRVLTRQLSVAVRVGHSILVTGPNASGKSSLFRILGGLWPLAAGSVLRPGHNGVSSPKDIFYVPQKPYTAPGSLREQVIYPLSVAEAAQNERGGTDDAQLKALDARLDGLMEAVRLAYLVRREGGWDATASWGDTLSLGEQQRMGMARLFFRAPRFGVLDECTNAISVEAEEALYAHASSLGITLVTITQRAALLAHHAAELRLSDANGAWQLRALPA